MLPAAASAEETKLRNAIQGSAVLGAGSTITVTDAATIAVPSTPFNNTYHCTKASSTQTAQLPPAIECPGAIARFVCGNAGGEILINPAANDQVSIKGLVDHSTSVKPTAGTGVKNTAATNVVGDHISLQSDGVATWHEIAGAGIWASQ